MIPKIVILFVFGATIASAQFMPRLIRPTPYDMSPYLRSNGCPSGPALAPVICQFMQPSLNFKPQLIAPTTYIPPLVVEKCDTPQLEIEIPTPEHIVIPEAPILPPITVPKFPVPVIPEYVPPMPIVEPCEPAPVAVSSAVSVPVAPVLPPLEMPAFPEIVEYQGADMSGAMVNEIDYQSTLGLLAPAVVIPEPVPVRPLAPIPPAPVLPPAPLLEIVSVPVAPELPPLELPEIVEYHGADISGAMVNEINYQSTLGLFAPSIVISEPVPVRPLAPIPPAPVLPPAPLPEIPVRVEIPAGPIAPPMFEEPCITDVVVHEPMLPLPAKLPLPLPVPMPFLPMPESAIIAEPCEPAIAPMPILPIPEPAIMAEPCEPAIAPVVKIPGRQIYRPSPAFPAPGMGPVLFPARMMRGNVFASLPYMRRI